MAINGICETVLWQRIIEGDKNAFSDLYREYHPHLYDYGSRLVSDTTMVEDAIQDIFLQFWLNRQHLRKVTSHKAYFFVSFRRRLLKKSPRGEHLLPESEGFGPVFLLQASVDQLMINKESIFEQHTNLDKAIAKITERQKEAIFLMFYQNLSYPEIADLLGISVKATYKLIARAIGELREAYKENSVTHFLFIPVLLAGLAYVWLF